MKKIIILIAIILLFLIGVVYAAVNDVQWELGSTTLYSSIGATVTIRWGLGSVCIHHEYVAAGGAVSLPIINIF